jgi:Holliday junction resolvase
MTPEAKVKKKVVETLKRYSVYWFYASTHGYGSSGVPDLVACYNGQFIGIEVKADARKNPPTALQQDNLERIKQQGGVALVIDTHNLHILEEVLEAIHAPDRA